MPSSKQGGFAMTFGTRAQVWHGTAKKTSGGLMKGSLMKNKGGRIVSRAKHNSAKKDNRLVKAGYLTKKGQFGFVKSGTKKSRRGKAQRGGSPYGSSFSPSAFGDGIDGQGITPGGPETAALMAGGKRRKGRKGSRSRRGGSSYSPASYSSESGADDNMPFNGIAGAGITSSSGQGGTLTAALTAGGKRRRNKRGKKSGRRRHGGTAKQPPLYPSSVEVQMAAGAGN